MQEYESVKQQLEKDGYKISNEKLQKKNKELELLLEETKKSIENVSKHSENNNPVEPEGILSENGLPEQKDDQKKEGD